MAYTIIRTPGSLVDLEKRVNASGGDPQGGPFYNQDTREWCQAVLIEPASDTVELREHPNLKPGWTKRPRPIPK